jgi:hypothetical protein
VVEPGSPDAYSLLVAPPMGEGGWDMIERRDWGEGNRGHAGRGPRGHRRSDARIFEDVCDRLTDDRHVDASDIEVEVSEGEVTLKGSVGDRGMRRRAEAIVEEVAGVRHVSNELRVRPQGTTDMVVGLGTPVAAAYGLGASPSADAAGDRAAALSGSAGVAAEAAIGRATGQPRTIAALFDALADAEGACEALIGAGIDRDAVSILRSEDVRGTRDEPPAEQGFLATLKSVFSADAEREAYAEGIRRGGAVITAVVPETRSDQISRLLRDHGAVDLDARRGEWRATGWREYKAAAETADDSAEAHPS